MTAPVSTEREAARELELWRHTDNDGDRLTDEGVRAAEEIGGRLRPAYAFFASSGAARATQMAEILRAKSGQEDAAIIEVPALRSTVEDRWRASASAAGNGADLEAIRRVDPDLVEHESRLLGTALRDLLARLPAGRRGLFVGHTPTIEAAVLGLTGQLVPPLGKGEGVAVTAYDKRFEVAPLS